MSYRSRDVQESVERPPIYKKRSPRPLLILSITGAIVALNIACLGGFVTGPFGFVLKLLIGLGDRGYLLPLQSLLALPVLGAIFGMGSGVIAGPLIAGLAYAAAGRFSERHWIKQHSPLLSGVIGGLFGGLLAAFISGFLAGLTINPSQ